MIYLKLFLTFFKIGLFTFGGGYAMLPLIQQQVVEKQWMTLERVNQFVSISESTPGPFAVNMATYVGAEMGGVFGSVCATLGIVLPSFIVILIVAKCYEKRAHKLSPVTRMRNVFLKISIPFFYFPFLKQLIFLSNVHVNI